MQLCEQDTNDERSGLGRALHRLTDELAKLATGNQLVQEAVAVALEQVHDRKSTGLAAVQHLDAMYQTLVGLARFTDQLARQTPSDLAVDARAACAGIELTALIERLSAADSKSDAVVSASGDYEHFEIAEPADAE